jgi:hypothetical protein
VKKGAKDNGTMSAHKLNASNECISSTTHESHSGSPDFDYMKPTVRKARSRGIPKKRLKFNESPHFLGLKLAKEELISVKNTNFPLGHGSVQFLHSFTVRLTYR